MATSANIATKYMWRVLIFTHGAFIGTHPSGLWCAGTEGPSEDLLVSCSVCCQAGVAPLAMGWLSSVERSARSGW